MHQPLAKTEQRAGTSKGMDQWENHAVLLALWQGQAQAVTAVKAAIPQMSDAANAIVARLMGSEGRLIYVGAGSSGLLAMQDGMEMTPTFNWPPSRLVFLMAGGDQARLTPVGVAEDDDRAAVRDLERIKLQKTDVIIAVAASGTTPYTVCVLAEARKIGALSVGIANNADTEVLTLSDFAVLLDSGPEVITGSTRLAAGTAQKAALGMLSSLVMTRMGHVVDGWMVDMIADNSKLRTRAMHMVSDISACPQNAAQAALQSSAGNIKLAVLIALGASTNQGKELLEKSNGHLRAAMEALTTIT